MSWVPRVVGPLFRALRFSRGARRVTSSVGKRLRIQTAKYPIQRPGRKLLRRHRVPIAMKKKSASSVGPMPFYRRRRVLRRRPIRRRRYVKKTANKVHTFVRWCDKDTTYGDKGPNQILASPADQHLAYQFKLDNLSGVSDFVNLYDGYKINKIQLFLEPFWDQTFPNGPSNLKMSVVHDYNDAFPLTNEDEYLEYGNCKRYFMTSKRGIRITLYPKINNVIENAAGAATGFTSLNSNRQFLNIATDEVPHFGIKMLIPGGAQAPEGSLMFRVRAKYWVSMRGTK